MASIFKLKRDATELNLLAAAGAGWRVTAWNPQVSQATPGRLPPPVTETMDAIVDRSSDDNLAASFQDMNDMRMGAPRYIGDRTEEHPVWLHCKMDNETGERRALVREITLTPMSAVVDSTGLGADSKAKVRMTIVREIWEGTTQIALPSASPAAAASVIYDHTSAVDVVGDAPARIALTRIASSVLEEIWIGARSANKHGTLANFVNIWECELGTLGTDAALGADATASPGGGGNTCVVITPGTATWAKRLTIYLSDVTANSADNFGNFLWLLRAKTDALTNWEAQLRFGYKSGSDESFVEGHIHKLSGFAKGNNYAYLESGISPLPLLNIQAELMSVGEDENNAIQVWARRTIGTGVLRLDCLCPVPIDESFMSIKNLEPAGMSGFIRYGTTPQDHDYVMSLEAMLGGDNRGARSSPVNDGLRLPVGDGRLIIVYSRDYSILSDAININTDESPGYFPRWHTLRGSE